MSHNNPFGHLERTRTAATQNEDDQTLSKKALEAELPAIEAELAQLYKERTKLIKESVKLFTSKKREKQIDDRIEAIKNRNWELITRKNIVGGALRAFK